jgi:DNA-binding IclR family transcriptional regulator
MATLPALPALWSRCEQAGDDGSDRGDDRKGRIFLSHNPPETTQPMLEKELEGRADIDRAQIDAWIAEVRRNGYSALDGMLISGLKAISAPVFNTQGELVAAMSLVGPQKAR